MYLTKTTLGHFRRSMDQKSPVCHCTFERVLILQSNVYGSLFKKNYINGCAVIFKDQESVKPSHDFRKVSWQKCDGYLPPFFKAKQISEKTKIVGERRIVKVV